MINCLLIGYGKIAQIHAKYLNLNHINWYWYDPFIENINQVHNRIESLENIESFIDKVFILTPEDTHYSTYKLVRKFFSKDIFIEKPAIVDNTELDMLDDQKLMIGLVERFNPAVQTLLSHIDVNKIINIDFSRCCMANSSSSISVLKDIGIHDIDLFFYLINFTDDVNKIQPIMSSKNNTILLHLNYKNILTRFIWSKDTFFKERKIIVRQTDYTYFVDLQEQSVNRYFNNDMQQTICESLFVEKNSPIANEQKNFLSINPYYITAKQSHQLLLKLIHND